MPEGEAVLSGPSSVVVRYLLYQGEQCDPAVGQPRLLPPWTVWSPPFLPEPTFLLSFLTLSFSISSILNPFPIHDDTFLPIYPIQLILLPINYDDVYPQAGSSTWCGVQPAAVRGVQSQPAAVCGVQPQLAAARGAVYSPSQQQFVVYSPNQQQFVVYSPS